jgi:mRNA-degrading endonuclease RelE of RelBE toxin-antitoxin system
MPWTFAFAELAEGDLRAFDKKTQRFIITETRKRLAANPKAKGRNIKDLRPNLAAQRELRLPGGIRVLFDVDEPSQTVIIRVVGLKQRETLLVRGKEYTRHHENRASEGS